MEGAAQPDTPSPVVVIPSGVWRHPGNTDPDELTEPAPWPEYTLVCSRLGLRPEDLER